MATINEVDQALLDAIDRVAAAIKPETIGSSRAASFATAAKDLAEAHAWLFNGQQPH